MLKITKNETRQPVYDITVENVHNFYANGALVHNCVEITLPTKPVRNVFNEEKQTVEFEGLIQLCTLAAVNLGNINIESNDEFEKYMDLLVRLLNELLDYQDYMVPQARRATMSYRPLGIGVVNYAYALAKNGMKYGDQNSLDLTHRVFEKIYYYGLKASMELAKERGTKLPGINETIYADGELLIDNYCKSVDSLTEQQLLCDWESLRADVKQYGVFNSTISALMPSESSSVVSNATNGIEPIRSLLTKKASKKASFVVVAPESSKLKNAYQYLWDMTPKDFEGYIKCAAVMQKFVCQSISSNLSYNPRHFPNNKISIEAVMNHTFLAARLGIKTRYYANTQGEVTSVTDVPEPESDPAQVGESADDCDSCKI